MLLAVPEPSVATARPQPCSRGLSLVAYQDREARRGWFDLELGHTVGCNDALTGEGCGINQSCYALAFAWARCVLSTLINVPYRLGVVGFSSAHFCHEISETALLVF